MAEQAQPAAPAPGGKKTLIMVAALMAVEAIVIIGAIMMVGRPGSVQAKDDLPAVNAEEEKIVEVQVLKDRLLNDRSGANYIHDVEIWAHVKKKHEARVTDELTRFKNEIKSQIMAIWRAAEPRHIAEPRLENLTRKIEVLLHERFGDEGENGERIIQKCVVVAGPGFRIDG